MPNLMEMTHTDVSQHIETLRIAEQNDLARKALSDDAQLLQNAGNGLRCKVMLTSGISGAEPEFISAVMKAVALFDGFSEDNDPWGIRDFGAVNIQGQKVFWKFDFFDADYHYASPDMADLAVTRRVLTIMLASEY